MNLFQAMSCSVLLTVGVFLTGCGDDDKKPQAQSESESKHDIVLRVAVNQDMPPFVFVNEQGQFIGMDVEIIKAIAMKWVLGWNCIICRGRIYSPMCRRANMIWRLQGFLIVMSGRTIMA